MYHFLFSVHLFRFEHNRDHIRRVNRKYPLGIDEKNKEKQKNDRVHASEVTLMNNFVFSSLDFSIVKFLMPRLLYHTHFKKRP